MKVAVTCTHMQRDIDPYRADFSEAQLDLVLPAVPGQELAGSELIEAMAGIHGVIAGDDQFSREVLEALPDLRAISKWGIGLDGIDLAAAEDLGVEVTNTPGMFGNEVAEQALAYLLVLIRGTIDVDREVREGRWPKPVGRSLGALRACVLGLGDIGRSLVTKLEALGVAVTGVDPSPEARHWAQTRELPIGELDELLPDTDVLIITCPLNAATRGLIDDKAIELLPTGSYLINVGRGPVVVGDAVADGLESGRLAGAALDVFEKEPLANERLRGSKNLVLGSHNASNTQEACHRTHRAAIVNLLANLVG